MQLDFCVVRVQNPVTGFRPVQAHNFAIPLLGQAKTSKLKARSFLEPETVYMEDPIVLDFISVPIFHHRDEHVP
jgi:hypothetical protein